MAPVHASRRELSVRGPIALGAAALAALGVLGGVGALTVGPHPGGSAPQQIPVSAVATTTNVDPEPGSGDEQKLIDLLPPGYGPKSCHTPKGKPANAIATLDCFDNSSPGGPTIARYSLFSDATALESSFRNRTLKDVTATPCPNGDKSPGTWGYGADAPDAGSLVCGTDPSNSNNPTVGWTENALLFQAVTEGPDLEALYKWWQRLPGPPQGKVGRS